MTRFGYEPALDGLRAISVIAVLLYHGGFSWMKGGFLGVEVFFVVSGFLITTLLIEERRRSGAVALGAFWVRRFRRLLPALLVVLVAVTVWVLTIGTAEQASQVRRDLPWALFYVANWGQISGETPYFAPGDPPMLRHLWSLAVEEQWYVIWPLVVVAIAGVGLTARRSVGWAIAGVGIAVMVATRIWSYGDPIVSSSIPVIDGADRINVLYLSTITRSSGLLLGAAAAFLWQPWRSMRDPGPAGRNALGAAAAFSIGALAAMFIAVDLTDLTTYRAWLPLTTIASLVAVLAAVHHDGGPVRAVLSTEALVAIGKRSYGWYLWSWPVAVAFGATAGAVWPFIAATIVALALAEVSYRYVETPIRRGAIGRMWKQRPELAGRVALASTLTIAALGFAMVRVETFDRFEGNDQATFDVGAAVGGAGESAAATEPLPGEAPTPVPPNETGGEDAGVATTLAPPTTATPTTTLPPVPQSARLAIVGDSTANALAINEPDGIDAVFPSIENGSVPGCGVYDSGKVVSERAFNNDFAVCIGWEDRWARAAAQSDVALVWIGAWEVFDLTAVDDEAAPGSDITFGTSAADRYFTSQLRAGVEQMLATGANVGLLEVACMRPIDADGTPVPALPERGSDSRVERLNGLQRRLADEMGSRVRFIEGPDAWCDDEAVASDTGLRWDGVHVYGRGANMIFEEVASDLLELAAVG